MQADAPDYVGASAFDFIECRDLKNHFLACAVAMANDVEASWQIAREVFSRSAVALYAVQVVDRHVTVVELNSHVCYAAVGFL